MLKLLDERKARVFGVPVQDTDESSLRNELRAAHPGWTDAEIEAHIQAALAAGVYREEEEE